MLNETYLIWKPFPLNARYLILSNGDMIYDKFTKRYLIPFFKGGDDSSRDYKQINLYIGEALKILTMHFVVARTFIGKRPKNYQINHKNAIKHDNAFDNLEYLSGQDNVNHARKLGLTVRGTKVGNSKLTEEEVLLIVKSPQPSQQLADAFTWSGKKISASLIRAIRRGERWNWLTKIKDS